MSLLKYVRRAAIKNNRLFIVRFHRKEITVQSGNAGAIQQVLTVPTLHSVNYDTTLGTNRIVFDGHGTDTYNLRVHGGDITLKSRVGFERSIHVNCTGLAREGLYPIETAPKE